MRTTEGLTAAATPGDGPRILVDELAVEGPLPTGSAGGEGNVRFHGPSFLAEAFSSRRVQTVGTVPHG